VVDKDNTVAIRDKSWQIDKTRFRNSLAGSTVTIHEHLDETVSIRYGPHVVGRYDRNGEKLNQAKPKERRGKGGSMEASKAGFHRLPHSLGNLAKNARFPLFHRADCCFCSIQKKSKGKNQNPKKRRPKGRIALFHKADRSLINKTGRDRPELR
jgi:hypothetical protein